jgi:phage gp46-like protein
VILSDIRIIQYKDFPREAVGLDWLLKPNGGLDETQALATAVILAFGTWRRAETTDILPDLNSDDRMGWWGDMDAAEIWDGWPIGSRFWLMRRDKIVGPEALQGSTIARAESYAYEALQPFVDKRIASRVHAVASRRGLHTIVVDVTIYRGPDEPIELRFEGLWDELEET